MGSSISVNLVYGIDLGLDEDLEGNSTFYDPENGIKEPEYLWLEINNVTLPHSNESISKDTCSESSLKKYYENKEVINSFLKENPNPLDYVYYGDLMRGFGTGTILTGYKVVEYGDDIEEIDINLLSQYDPTEFHEAACKLGLDPAEARWYVVGNYG